MAYNVYTIDKSRRSQMSWLGITHAGPDEDNNPADYEPDGLDDDQWDWAMDDLRGQEEGLRRLLWDETEPFLVRIREPQS
jgi:hypothetical protein